MISNSKLIFFFACCQSVILVIFVYYTKYKSHHHSVIDGSNKFSVSYTNDPNDNKCRMGENPMCCEMLTTANSSFSRRTKSKESCKKVSSVYFSSPHEIKHFQKATEIQSMPSLIERTNSLLNFMESDMDDSMKMLDRVRSRMTSNAEEDTIIDDDMKYLSKFVVTYSCFLDQHNHKNITRTEWIEPLTIHARYPTSYIKNWMYSKPGVDGETTMAAEYEKLHGIPIRHVLNTTSSNQELSNVDYVLLQKGNNMHNHKANGLRRKNIFLDAGTYTFNSDLTWFMCSYIKVLSPKFE